MKMKVLLFVLLLSGCASVPHDFHGEPPGTGSARVYIYRPHALEMMLAEYQISLQQKPVKILEDEGYFYLDVPPGKMDLRSKHTQDNEIVMLPLDVAAGRTYFVKLDPEAEKLSLVEAVGDILAVGTLIRGEKARLNIENGRGDLGDVYNAVEGERARSGLKATRTLGHHVLLEIEERAARRELQECCSSKRVSEVR